MKVFVDTNIVVELLENRVQAEKVDRIFAFCEQNLLTRFISVGSFYTLTYLTERMLRHQHISQPELVMCQRDILNDILAAFEIAPSVRETLQAGVNDKAFTDLEDSYQHQSAIAADCDVLLTINTKDFPRNSKVRIMSPDEFIETYL